jgi:hypothetical protein
METKSPLDIQIPLDPNRDRYRICPYWECRKPFMTKHRSRDFCSQKCHDDYHNQQKRLLKYGDEISKDNQHDLVNTQASENLNVLENNISILNELPLEEDGSFFDISELINIGFDFTVFTFRYKLPNTMDSFFMLYGPYQIYLTEPNKILIYLKQNQNEIS